jgi:hypothetical protein
MRGVFEAMTDIVLVLNTQTGDGDITDIKVARQIPRPYTATPLTSLATQ